NLYKRIALILAVVSVLATVLTGNAAADVVVTASGDPIEGALVKLTAYPQYNGTTDVNGDYTINNVPVGSYFMLTTHPDYAPNITSINSTTGINIKNITLDVCRDNFSDVGCVFWGYVYVMYLYDNGVTSGYPDGTFKPDNQISRAETATFIVRAMNLTYTGGLTDFSDVPPTHWAYQYIMAAKQNGIVGGYPDGTFLPDNLVSRAEISVMVSRARGWSFSGIGVDFIDVPSTHWSYPYVMTVKEKGVVGGYPDGTFLPDNRASRAETSVMTSRMRLWV
ncbi:MAG: S-layer homology domain-containing protein, partial [ANME-2 cluster archaeon]|nr:S-layer homology domain-containing protein [ANME-2 cluster archaeon]